MNERERQILFKLLIDLFVDGEQQENKQERSKQQQQGAAHENVSAKARQRTRKHHQ
jgi:hypothetical protein